MGRTLRAEDPNHLITYHPFGRTQSSTWFHAEPWLDFNMFQSGHRRYDQDTDSPKRFGEDNWRYVLDDYVKDPPKPVLDGEPSYENIPQGLHDGSQPYWTAADARRYAYWSVFAGACGHTYGDNAVMQFHAPGSGPGDYSPRNYWFDAINDPGAGQMRHLAALMRSRPVLRSRARPGSGCRRRRRGTRACHRDTGPRLHDGLLVHRQALRAAPGGDLRPVAARVVVQPARRQRAIRPGWWPNTGTQRFTPPGEPAEGHDWVLVLDNASKRFAPPGR